MSHWPLAFHLLTIVILVEVIHEKTQLSYRMHKIEAGGVVTAFKE